MPQFSYRARNAQGGLVEGVLECADRSVAIRQIEQLHYMPVRIELVGSTTPPPEKTAKNGAAAPVSRASKAPIARTASPTPTQKLKISHTQILIFTEQLGHLLKAGMTLDEGLQVLEK